MTCNSRFDLSGSYGKREKGKRREEEEMEERREEEMADQRVEATIKVDQ